MINIDSWFLKSEQYPSLSVIGYISVVNLACKQAQLVFN